ncbi:MAG: RdgB/HAM1 family non-canonical purine NTP pyrophosphatase [Brevinematia bacterium]
MKKILIGTTNKSKIIEIKEILSQVLDNVEFLSLSDFPKVKEPEEKGKTFFENSLIKAKYYYSIFKIPVLTDDSGLEVFALNGEPGVRSARYAGENPTQKDLINKLLRNLEGKENREARFVCVAIFMFDKDKYIFAEGTVKGTIIYEPRGSYGFGYDPVFLPEGYDKTFAELGPEIKNKISHRRNAFISLALKIKELNIL